MPRLVLPVVIAAVCVGFVSGGCQFYTVGDRHDAEITDVERSLDAVDQDHDAADGDGAVIGDAAPQEDAAIEQCSQVGGVCTANPNAICPPGTLPFGDDESLDCAGHCCVPDEASTCNASPDTNCAGFSGCTGCWVPAANATLQCFSGRPCCEWDCGG